MSIMETYAKALQAIYDHVGFVEDWTVYPIGDRTEVYWRIVGEKTVFFAKDKKVLDFSRIEEADDDELYSDEIYHQRFYSKAIYRGEQYTLIIVDTHTDGNKFFAIFNNEKEIKILDK